ncbi:MAG: carboxypeptidase-like regulatory domain-containing protein [Planctomycetota bacterium]
MARVFILLAVVATAFAGGYLLGQGKATAPSSDLAVRGPDREATDHARAPALSGRSEGTSPDTELLDVGRSALREALAKLPKLDVPTGTDELRVRVVTEEGQPLEGVEVRAIPIAPPALLPPDYTPWDLPEQHDLPELLELASRRLRWAVEASIRGTTDADGVATLRGDRRRPYELSGRKHGWRIRDGLDTHGPFAGALDGRVMEASPVGYVDVSIVRADGSAPAVAGVRHRGELSGHQSWRPGRGPIELPLGEHELTATVTDDEQLISDPIPVSLATPGEEVRVRLELHPQTVLHGVVSVTGPERYSAPGYKLVRVPDGVAPSEQELRRSDSGWSQPLDGREASWTFRRTQLEPGPHVLGIFDGRNSAFATLLAWRAIDVQEGENRVEVELPPLARDRYAVLWLEGPDGPLQDGIGIASHVEHDGKRINASESQPVLRPDGALLVPHPIGADAREGATVALTVSSRALGRRTMRYPAGTAPELRVRFERALDVDVVIRGIPSPELRRDLLLVLDAEPPDVLYAGPPSKRLDEAGHALFARMQPGPCRIDLLRTSTHGRRIHLASWRATLQSPSTSLTFDMPSLHDVGFEGLPRSGASVTRLGEQPTFRMGFAADADGRARLEGLPSGPYELRVGERRIPFELPASSVVRVE